MGNDKKKVVLKYITIYSQKMILKIKTTRKHYSQHHSQKPYQHQKVLKVCKD